MNMGNNISSFSLDNPSNSGNSLNSGSSSNSSKSSNSSNLKNNNLDNLKNNLMMEIDHNVDIYPFMVDNKDKTKYQKYSKIGCFKTQEKEVFCKHIHNNILSDLMTFNLDNCIEKNAEEILKNREILDLRSIPGLKEYTREQKIEFYKNKLFLEPYIKETKEDNNSTLINNLQYFVKLKNFYSDEEEIKTICEIMKNNGNEGYLSLGYMQDNKGDIYFLKKNNQIYTEFNSKKELIFSILDEEDNILSEFIIPDKIEENYGEEINFYVSTNNKNIFEKPFYTENLNNVTIPYLSGIDIDITN